MDAIIIGALIVILIILVIWILVRSYAGKVQLKTRSIVIVDSRGQHIVDETEFVRFMENLESIFSDTRNLSEIKARDLAPRKARQNKERYINKSSEELKSWIRNHNNYPWISKMQLSDPMTEELEGMQGENNHLLFDRSQDCNTFDGPNVEKDSTSSMYDIANYIKQIKEITLKIEENKRDSVNLTATHNLLVNVLEQYYDVADLESMTNKPIIESVKNIKSINSEKRSAVPKMKKHRENLTIKPPKRNNVIVDVSGFHDDDRLASAYNESDRNSAIESMLVKKSTTHAKLTGGRNHILL
jgi:hypothetical protein